MISIYNILNIRIFNFYLTKLSEKIYKYLRKSTKKTELNFLRQTIESLHKTVYYKDTSRPLMWSNLYPDYNLCIQQKIVQDIGFMKFTISLVYFLSNKKKIIYVLSNNWIKKLKENKIRVNAFISRILSVLYCISFFVEGLFYFFLVIYKYFNFKYNFLHLNNLDQSKNTKIFANVNLSEKEILQNSNFDLVYWINKNFKEEKNIFFVNKNIKRKLKEDIFSVPDPLFFYIKNLNLYKFLIYFLIIIFLVIIDLLFLKLSNLILFKEKIEASIIRCSNFKKKLISILFLHKI